MAVNIEINRDVLGRQITIQCTSVGKDYCILCQGGDSPHIGAVALAEPCCIEGKENASVSSICAVAHRDDVLGRQIALKVCRSLRAVVAVSCGVHYNEAGNDDIYKILQIADNMVEELIQLLTADC